MLTLLGVPPLAVCNENSEQKWRFSTSICDLLIALCPIYHGSRALTFALAMVSSFVFVAQ